MSKQGRIRVGGNLLPPFGQSATHEVTVRVPDLAVVVGKGGKLSGDVNRELLVGNSRQNLNCIERGRPTFTGKGEMEHTVFRGRAIPEDAFVGNVLSHRIGIDIERAQYHIAVDLNAEG